MNKIKKDYLSVIYNEIDRPFTDYPNKLTSYLVTHFNLQKNMKSSLRNLQPLIQIF